jgi:hypothetical protein
MLTPETMGKLDAIIAKINTEKRLLLSVFDHQSQTNLYKYYPATAILTEFESGENFFESLNEKGYRHLTVGAHLKNGTGKIKAIEPVEVQFGVSIENESSLVMEHQQPSHKPSQVATPKPTPMDVTGLFGLGAPQIMELLVKKHEADRLTLENSELRADNRSLKDKNEQYREEILKDKYDYQREKEKKGDTHALIGQIAGSLPAIMQYIKPNPSEGLSASQPQDYGSPAKNSFVQNLPQIDDATLLLLVSIWNNMNTNTAFSNELVTLLKKHQLWQ